MNDIEEKLVKGERLGRTYKERKPGFIFKKVKVGYEAPYLDDPNEQWIVHSRSKRFVTLKQPKRFDAAFEDKIWCLLAELGFDTLNEDRNFRLDLLGVGKGKQIDVFAMDNETILIVECKACETRGPRDLQKDIIEAEKLRHEARRSLRTIFGEKKVEWLFASNNVNWSDEDIERLKKFNMTLLRENDIEYYYRLIDVIGKAAKYQLLAEIFKKREIPNLGCVVPAIKGRMGSSYFYAFAIEPAILLKIGYICHRMKGNDDKTITTYQRMLERNRIKEIRRYIEDGGGFPNSIVINVESGNSTMEFNQKTHKGDTENETKAVLGLLHLPSRYKSAYIIDGQHRLYGFSGSERAEKTTIPVIAFENLPAEAQAELFVDINSKQKKVSKNLLDELAADTKWGSELWSERLQALVARTFITLRDDPSSPFFGRISTGESKKDAQRPLTVASLTTPLARTNLIYGVRKARGEETKDNGAFFVDGSNFMADTLNRTVKVLSAYFGAFNKAMPEQWEFGSADGGYVCTNVGITPLIMVLKAIIDHIDKEAANNETLKAEDMETKQLIAEVLKYSEPVVDFLKNADPELLKKLRKKVGGTGFQESANVFMEQINKGYPDFTNKSLEAYLMDKSSATNEQANHIMPSVRLSVYNIVIPHLKEQYGTGEDGWWVHGVPQTVRTQISARREADPERPSYEHLFDLSDFKKVIMKNEELRRFLSRGEEKLGWIDQLVKIKKKIDYPERGIVTTDELERLKKIRIWLSGIEVSKGIVSDLEVTQTYHLGIASYRPGRLE